MDQLSPAEKQVLQARMNLELQRLDTHFETWAETHNPILKQLYSKFVDDRLYLHYDDFVYLAYRCTIH